MSTFRVPVVRVRAVEPIPGADAIELATVGDFRSVVGKGRFVAGDLAAYLPEGGVLPERLLRRLALWDEARAGAVLRVRVATGSGRPGSAAR